MLSYIIRRLLLLPLTLFGIILVNFIIINLAPGEPTTATEVSAEGQATRRDDRNLAFGADERYLQMREHFGLTLPILFNTWPWMTQSEVRQEVWQVAYKRYSPEDPAEMRVKDYEAARLSLGDKSRFIMPHLLALVKNEKEDPQIRRMASRFFARGGTRQAIVGPHVTSEERAENQKIAVDNGELRSWVIAPEDTPQQVQAKAAAMQGWYDNNKETFNFEPDASAKWYDFFFETRFYRYMSRVITLDFGTLRNDDNKTVIDEVTKRFKYSLTLAVLPMIITFVLCIVFGFIMAMTQGRWPDISLNVVFLILYAIPIFVVAPFLIEAIGLHGHFPFTDIPVPYSGFTSKESVYENMTSWQRLWDVLQHIYLPIIAITYGSLAAQSRLSRTAVLEVLRQDYVRTARAKGLSRGTIMAKHVARNASITIVTSIAGSLGVILGGSLIVETLFEINGFGKFFYDAVINWDYNVIMFSALAGAFLTLVGYLLADVAYTLLDPRVTLD
ncbi:MAG: ABC transporter permease [Chlamydiales bacterium]|nr:ABC transporter permease [Chlamydiales bacterium]